MLGQLAAQGLVGLALLDGQRNVVHANRTLCDWLGHAPDELSGRNFRELMSRGRRLFFDTQLEPMLQLHHAWREVALELDARDGSTLPLIASAARCENQPADGRPQVLVTMFRATERRRYEQELLRARKQAEESALALFDEKERARVTLESVGEGVLVVDEAGKLSYLNHAAEQLTGLSRASAAGLPIETVLPLLHEVDSSACHPVRIALQSPGAPQRLSGLLPVAGGEPRYVEGTVAHIAGRGGFASGAVAVVRDVTDARLLHRRLTYQATHDLLTGIPNRPEFERAVGQALDGVQKGERPHALLFLDLDGFKIINDTCGHLAGDELLRQVGQLLATMIRSTDVLARLGGDEFGILLRHCPVEEGERVAGQIVATVAAFRFAWQSQFFRLGVSVGAAPVDAHCEDVTDALSAADSACGWAKARGRNQVQVFRRDNLQQRRLHEQKDWLGKLNRALSQDTLVLFAQRIGRIDSRAAGPAHYEVLLRMREDDGTLVGPGLFLPVAERYRMMVRIDEWVVSKLLEQLAPEAGELAATHEFSVNLSGASINDPAFLDFLLAAFERHQVPGSLVSFEITETVAIASFAQAVNFIERLAAIGCRFLLDDFGSGLSSFDYLRKLPVSAVKIDGSFIEHVASDPVCRAMVDAIRRVSTQMKLETVAERVESEADLQVLRELGVDYVQGYVLHRPEPLAGLWRTGAHLN